MTENVKADLSLQQGILMLKGRGMNGCQIAKAAKVSTSLISRTLKGEIPKVPNYNKLMKYLKEMGVYKESQNTGVTSKGGGGVVETLLRYISRLERDNARLESELLRLTTGEFDRRKRGEA